VSLLWLLSLTSSGSWRRSEGHVRLLSAIEESLPFFFAYLGCLLGGKVEELEREGEKKSFFIIYFSYFAASFGLPSLLA
jgi:hypothetical protein